MAERRPPGRPPLQRGQQTVSIHVRVPTTAFDAACQRASAERMSLAEWTRQAIHQRVQSDEDDEE